MYGPSKFIALLLAFTLGFSCAGGILVGGAAIALGTFRVRDLEKHGIDIPDEAFMGKDYEVDLLNLSILEMIEEVKELSALKDNLTLNKLQKRYDLKIDPKVDVLLSDEVREMPIKKLFSKDGINQILSTVYVGKVLGHACVDIVTGEDADPSLGDELTKWVYADSGEDVVGIQAYASFICLGDFTSGNFDVNSVIGGLTIGDALGYKCIDKENDIWVDANGDEVVGVLAAFAGMKVMEVGTGINDIKIGSFLGYTYDEEQGCWVNSETAEPISGIMKVLADCTLENVGSNIEHAKLGDLLGYYYDEADGRWEEDTESNVALSGIMKILAPCTMDSVGQEIENAKLGDFFGYHFDETDGRWEEDAENNVALTGLMKILAPCTMDNVGEEIEKANLGDLLGYYYDEEEARWEEDAENNVPVTGFMKILADSTMDNVGDQIEDAYLGDLLGYQSIDGEWYEEDEGGNLVPVDGFMSAIADEKLDSLGNAFDTLTIGDIVGEEDRTGIFAILDPDAEISNMSDAINDSIMGSPIQFFINENLISFADAAESLDNMCNYFGTPAPGLDADPMDMIFWESYHDVELYAYIYEVEEGKEGYEEFEKLRGYYEYQTNYDENGNAIERTKLWQECTFNGHTAYRVPVWRTKQLNESFGYIIMLLSGTATQEPISDRTLNDIPQ